MSLQTLDQGGPPEPFASATEAGGGLSDDVVLRLWCHVLLDQVPLTGLPEARQQIEDLLDFYAQRTAPEPVPPLRSIEGVWGDRLARPDWVIEE